MQVNVTGVGLGSQVTGDRGINVTRITRQATTNSSAGSQFSRTGQDIDRVAAVAIRDGCTGIDDDRASRVRNVVQGDAVDFVNADITGGCIDGPQ